MPAFVGRAAWDWGAVRGAAAARRRRVRLRDPGHLPPQDRRDKTLRPDPPPMVRQAQIHRRDPEGGDDQRGLDAVRRGRRQQGARRRRGAAGIGRRHDRRGTIDIAVLARDLDQLWAEAVHRFRAGAIWWIFPVVDNEADAIAIVHWAIETNGGLE